MSIRVVVYGFIVAIVFILFKAFYLDSLPSETAVETNATIEENQSATVVAPTQTPTQDKPLGWSNKEGRPIDKLGDSIAEELKKKM